MALGVSQRELARILGVSQTAVFKATRAGRISTLPDGTYDPEIAAREWVANTNTSKTRTRIGVEHPERPAPPEATSYQKARAFREAFEAKKSELEYNRLTGRYVDAEKVKVETYALARRVRDLLFTLPARLGPVVAGISEPEECNRIIEREVRHVCEEMADWENPK